MLSGFEERSGLQLMLLTMSRMAVRVGVFAALVGAATFATGLAIFEGTGRPKWIIIGGALCAAPPVAAGLAAWRVRRTAAVAPLLRDEIRRFTEQRSPGSQILIDIDTGQTIAGRDASSLRAELAARRAEFPALSVAVRTLTTAPKLAGLATLGVLAVGALGTVLLIGALID